MVTHGGYALGYTKERVCYTPTTYKFILRSPKWLVARILHIRYGVGSQSTRRTISVQSYANNVSGETVNFV